MTRVPNIQAIEGKPLSKEQKNYLSGFFAGLASKGVTFGDLALSSGAVAADEEKDPLILEERIKAEEHPLESYYRLAENAIGNKLPDKEETFRFKWHGLFFLSPVKDAFMARLRIPGGQMKTFQIREVAHIAQELTTGYIQITTRANLQLRLIQPKDTPEFLRRVQSVGLHTRGSGADNIRNLTCNPTAGIDPVELIDCSPYIHEIGQYILSHREFYDLPRKFNVAFDGGGLIGTVEDTNDIGARAVKRADGSIGFRIALGGATGHKAFARDIGVVVKPSQLVKVTLALIRVYIANGNRTDRKKARLKHLLEKWSLEQYLAETEKLLGFTLEKEAFDQKGVSYPWETIPHSHIGVHAQKQDGLHFIGVALPVGQITAKQLLRITELADLYGSGEVRLTVWQNLIIPNIPTDAVESVKRSLLKMGLDYRQSNIASGFVACTGNRYCKFSSTDTKGHAMALSKHLESRVNLDVPVNIHFTGCPNSCAQHYMGDIGLLGAKTSSGLEGYHVCLGGGFGSNQALGRQVYQAMPFEEVVPTIERILNIYLKQRSGPEESFQSFTTRHDLNALQVLFST